MRVTKDPNPLQHLRLLLASRKGCDFKLGDSASVTTCLGCGGEFVPGSRSGGSSTASETCSSSSGTDLLCRDSSWLALKAL